MRILKWAAVIFGGLLAIFLITNAILIWIMGSRFEEKIEAIRSAGDPVTLADFSRDPIPSERNGAVFLRRAKPDIESIGKELANVYEKEGFVKGRLDKSDLNAIRSAFEAYPDVISLLRRAAECPDYDPRPDYTVDPHVFVAKSVPRVQDAWAVARVLVARAHLLSSQGERDEALRTCVLILKLSRHFEREPMLIGYLVVLACRSSGISAANAVLRSGPVPVSARESLEDELAGYDPVDAYRQALKSERAVGVALYHFYMDDWPARAYWLNNVCGYLDLLAHHIDLASRPYSETIAADPDDTNDAESYGPLTHLIIPGLVAARQSMEQVRARARCLRVLNVLQRHVNETGNADPKLSDLGLPSAATLDPFIGEPLHITKSSSGWVIYSVGKNLKNDGGDLRENRDVGLGPVRLGEG